MHRMMNLPSVVSQRVFPPQADVLAAALGSFEWSLLESSAWLQVDETGLVPDFPAHGAIIVPLALWQIRATTSTSTAALSRAAASPR
jgi:hypothetical protein